MPSYICLIIEIKFNKEKLTHLIVQGSKSCRPQCFSAYYMLIKMFNKIKINTIKIISLNMYPYKKVTPTSQSHFRTALKNPWPNNEITLKVQSKST